VGSHPMSAACGTTVVECAGHPAWFMFLCRVLCRVLWYCVCVVLHVYLSQGGIANAPSPYNWTVHLTTSLFVVVSHYPLSGLGHGAILVCYTYMCGSRP
jgi:hypothetical protein